MAHLNVAAAYRDTDLPWPGVAATFLLNVFSHLLATYIMIMRISP